MTAGDIRRALRYLVLVVLVYLGFAIATGHDVHLLELVVLAAGVLALATVAHRLGD